MFPIIPHARKTLANSKYMYIRCNKHRALSTVKSSFVRCTGTQNWEAVVRRFEAFADEDSLAQFIHLNSHKQIPEPFRNFCQAAVNSKNQTAVDCYTVVKEGTSGYVLQADPTALSETKIKETISCYTEQSHIRQVYNTLCMKSVTVWDF